jgi:hypothetical protein
LIQIFLLMTKLEKLRENLENNILELKEAWNLFEKERKATYTKIDSQIMIFFIEILSSVLL